MGTQLIGQIVVLGIVTGMRSMLGLAMVAWLAPPLAWMGVIWARAILGLAALGELVGDKLPKTPSRLAPGPLIARLVIGGLIGAAFATPASAPIWLGVPLGALGAAIGAFAGNKIRGALGRKTGLKDLYFALAEDALAIGLALFALIGPLAG